VYRAGGGGAGRGGARHGDAEGHAEQAERGRSRARVSDGTGTCGCLSERIGAPGRGRPDGRTGPDAGPRLRSEGTSASPGWDPVNAVSTATNRYACRTVGDRGVAVRKCRAQAIHSGDCTLAENPPTQWVHGHRHDRRPRSRPYLVVARPDLRHGGVQRARRGGAVGTRAGAAGPDRPGRRLHQHRPAHRTGQRRPAAAPGAADGPAATRGAGVRARRAHPLAPLARASPRST